MALIRCPECGKEISDRVRACIHCGYPLEVLKSESVQEKQKAVTQTIEAIQNKQAVQMRPVQLNRLKPFYYYGEKENALSIECGNCNKVYMFKKSLFSQYDANSCICTTHIICPNCKNGIDRGIVIKKKNGVTSANVPKCPTCKSTNISKISGLSKVGSVAIWGIFAAGKVSKTWHCNNCGSEW